MTTAPQTFVEPPVPSAATSPAKRSPGRPGWRGWRGWIVLTPIVVSIVYSALLTFKPTRAFALRMSEENYPVELLTFALLIAGGIYGLRLAIQARRRHPRPRPRGGLLTWWIAFYLMFSGFLLLIGMEEISWGQWFFHFRTPESIARINTQGEFTLHNLNGIGGKTQWLRLAFGVGGLVGIALGFLSAFRQVAVPPKLWAWFVVVIAFALGDIVTDYVGANSPVAALFEAMREIIELLIAAAACLYLWLKSKELLGTSPTP